MCISIQSNSHCSEYRRHNRTLLHQILKNIKGMSVLRNVPSATLKGGLFLFQGRENLTWPLLSETIQTKPLPRRKKGLIFKPSAQQWQDIRELVLPGSVGFDGRHIAKDSAPIAYPLKTSPHKRLTIAVFNRELQFQLSIISSDSSL